MRASEFEGHPFAGGNTAEKPDNPGTGPGGRSKQLGGNDGESGESDCALNADDPSQSPNLGAYAGKLSAYAGDIAFRGKVALPTTNSGNDGLGLTRIDVDSFEAADCGVSVEGAGGHGVSSPHGRGSR